MRIVSYRTGNETRIGIRTEDGLRDAGAFPASAEAFGSLAETGLQPGTRVPEGWTPAIPLIPGARIICIGLNYAEHAKEGGREPPDYPGLFLRVDTSLAANGEAVPMPAVSDRMDWEAELLVVIGKGGRAIPEAQALDHVFGYGVFNDISIRDYQRKGAQWTPGKNFDRTGVTGEEIVTPDELPKGATGLGIRAILNGQVMQDANTDMMIFPVAKAISIISEFMTLKPGDLIATGTPSGVGYARTPPVFMKPGDEIVIEIDRVGRIASKIEG
ncbi:FAA hydrolase family protein [Paracoccus sp. S-4012]|uniref:fumarylacetoacetate hydrolase family protein n=1 Tax=Paracoccus sp. S-4012 TaxID=2665648 RepID=UPI0012B0FC0F|nr:fumarylacetoacetate hydrolase family protein [Paracoccus sp. S-4012]MRX50546.1 FAA hydrolase family protein [Paracoccus sp. S-4012]